MQNEGVLCRVMGTPVYILYIYYINKQNWKSEVRMGLPTHWLNLIKTAIIRSHLQYINTKSSKMWACDKEVAQHTEAFINGKTRKCSNKYSLIFY